jgi:hypothetical protein
VEGPTAPVRGAGRADHLTPLVDPQGLAGGVARQRAQVADALAPGPREGVGLKAPPSAAETLEKPTTSPRSLMDIGVFQATPPRVPTGIARPRCQRTAWMALNRPTAWS